MHQKRKYSVRIDNVFFLKQLGASLRDATTAVPKEELTEDIRLALRRLDRLDAREKATTSEEPHIDPTA